MRIGSLILSTCLAATCAAQEAQPCGGGRTVDDYLADIAKSQKKQRNKNPLPNSICIGAWCRNTGVGPANGPEPTSHPNTKPQATADPVSEPTDHTKPADAQTSSSKQTGSFDPQKQDLPHFEPCDPEQAAKDVEVGDWHVKDKNYRGAVMRYKAALENWPHNPHIFFRMAKTYERMKDFNAAMTYYQSVVDADPGSPLAKEANAALTRLKK